MNCGIVSFTCFAFSHKIIEFIQKFIGAQLVRIGNLKVREQGIEVATQFELCRYIPGENRDRPRIRAWTTPRLADILFQSLAFLDKRPRAPRTCGFGRARRR